MAAIDRPEGDCCTIVQTSLFAEHPHMTVATHLTHSADVCQILCRRSGIIVSAYIASTVLVLMWLMYTVHITLQENREDADGVADPGTTSELIRVCLGRT